MKYIGETDKKLKKNVYMSTNMTLDKTILIMHSSYIASMLMQLQC